MIPKIIHYCWLSSDPNTPMPEEFTRYIAGWKEKLPDYQFMKWDFTRFDKESSEWVKEAFENKKYAFAADYIRFYAVYNYGGIYLDVDVEVLKKFDPLLEKDYMLAYERENRPLIESGCFGASKGNTFIGKCLEWYNGRHFVKEDGSFDMTPLPYIMDAVIKENKYEFEIFPWTYFTAKLHSTGEIKVTDDTFSIHHFAGSWKPEREQELKKEIHKLSKHFGYFWARNIAEFIVAIRHKEFFKVLKKKIFRKLKKSDRK